MTNFSNLFQSYSSNNQYVVARDTLVENDENPNLKAGVQGAGAYGSGGAGVNTIGYGYDISKHSGSQIISDFYAAKIFTSSNTSAGGIYANVYKQLQNYGTSVNDPNWGNVNTALLSAFGPNPGGGFSAAQSVALYSTTVAQYEQAVTTEANGVGNGIATANNSLHVLLFSEDYNGGNIFGSKQFNAIATDNVQKFLEDELFFNNTISSIYSQAIENRRIQDLANALGVATSNNGSANGSYVVTVLDFTNGNSTNNYISALQIYLTLTNNASDIGNQIAALGSTAQANLANFVANTTTNAVSTINSSTASGYYIIQTGDTSASIAAQFGISAITLQNINALFSDSGFAVGGVVHIPIGTGIPAFGLLSASLPALGSGQTYVYDPASNTIYTVGSSLDGHDSGALLISGSSASQFNFTSGAGLQISAPQLASVTVTGTTDAFGGNGITVSGLQVAYPSSTISAVTYNYDSNGNLLENIQTNLDGSRNYYEYNPTNNALATLETINPDGSGSILWGTSGANGSVAFTNESGFLTQVSATQDALSVSGSGSLTNTGNSAVNVEVASGTQLADVGSNFTIFDSAHAAQVASAGAALGTSSGTSPQTVITSSGTNNSFDLDNATITSTSTGAAINVTGGSNTLNVGQNSTLALNGGNDIVNANQSSTLQLTGFNNTVNAESIYVDVELNNINSRDQINMDNGFVNSGAGELFFLNGGSDIVTLAGNDTAIVDGGNDIIIGGVGNTVSVTLDTGNDTVDTSNSTIYAQDGVHGSGDSLIVNGSGNIIEADYNQDYTKVIVNGSNTFVGNRVGVDVENSGTTQTANAHNIDFVTHNDSTGGHFFFLDNSDGGVQFNFTTITLGQGSFLNNDGNGNRINGDGGTVNTTDQGAETTLDGNSINALGNGTTYNVGNGSTGDIFQGGGETINAGDGTSITAEGGNDIINGGSNDNITAMGDGDQINASGDNVTLKEDTGRSSSDISVNGEGNNIDGVDSGILLHVNGSDNIQANGDTVDLKGDGLSETLSGSNTSIESSSGGSGYNLNFLSGAVGERVDVSGSSISAAAGDQLGCDGSNDTVDASNAYIGFGDSGSSDNLDGGGNQVSVSNGNTVDVGSGYYGNIFYTQYAFLNFGDNDGYTIYGSYNYISGGDNGDCTVNGDDNTFDPINVNFTDNGQGNSFYGTGNTVTATANNISLNVYGSANTVNANNDTINLIGGGVNDTFNGIGSTIYAGNGNNQYLIIGSGSYGDTINANGWNINSASTSSFTLIGTSNVIGATGDSYVNASSDIINFTTPQTNFEIGSLTGDNNTVHALSGVYLYISGSGNSITASNDKFKIFGNNSVSGNGNTVTLVANETLSMTGASNILNLSNADHVALNGIFAGDTITGGTSDVIVAYGMSAYAVPQNSSDGSNILQIDGDISSLALTNIQTLYTDTVTLTATQLAAFNAIIGDASSNTIKAVTAGTYSLANVTSGLFNLDATGTTGNITLIGGSQNGETLIAGSGVDTLTSGTGGNTSLYGIAGDTINVGGNGQTGAGDLANIWSGTVNVLNNSHVDITGGGNIILAGQNDLLGVQGGNNNTITVGNGSYVYINSGTGDTLNATGATIYTASGVNLNLVGGGNNVNAASGTSVAVSGNGQWGNDNYIYLTNGHVTMADNSRADIIGQNNIIIAGNNDTIGVANSNGDSITAGSNGTIYANSGNDTIYASYVTVYEAANVTVTVYGGGDVVNAANGDSVTIAGNGQSGTDNYVNMSSGTVALIAGARADVSGAGNVITTANNDTLGIAGGNGNVATLGTSSGVWLSGGTGHTVNLSASDTVTISKNSSGDIIKFAGSGNDTVNNSGGAEFYQFGSTFGVDMIDNLGSGTGTIAKGEVDFTTSAITKNKLWFQKSGNDLLVDLLGTSDQIDLKNWYGSNAGAQVTGFHTSDGLKLDSSVAQLVQAMATYSSGHSGFNPQTAGTVMPTDTSLQSTLTSAWHS